MFILFEERNYKWFKIFRLKFIFNSVSNMFCKETQIMIIVILKCQNYKLLKNIWCKQTTIS
jgi:hypothetical protein